MRQFDVDPSLYKGKENYLALFEASYCLCGQEIVCETAVKSVKARLSGKEAMHRNRLDEEVFIQFNGPRLFEMDGFIEECSEVFLSRYREPLSVESKFRNSKFIDRLKRERSFLNW